MFFGKDINAYISEYKETPCAMLIDVREPKEYNVGHIPGARNIPLSQIDIVSLEKKSPIFVYCLRGARSRKAVRILKNNGYRNAVSIGGIAKYKGPIER